MVEDAGGWAGVLAVQSIKLTDAVVCFIVSSHYALFQGEGSKR